MSTFEFLMNPRLPGFIWLFFKNSILLNTDREVLQICVNISCRGQLQTFPLKHPHWVVEESALLWKPSFLSTSTQCFQSDSQDRLPAGKDPIEFSQDRGIQSCLYLQVIVGDLNYPGPTQTHWICVYEGEIKHKYTLKAFQVILSGNPGGNHWKRSFF